MKKLIYVTALSALLLAACGDSTTETELEKEVEVEEKEYTATTENNTQTTNTATAVDWQAEIQALATNSDVAADKFYALEKFMMAYEPTEAEIEQFKNDIIADYKSGSYLSEIENHERMLTNTFKSYIVESNSEGAVADFAFDYFQNMKYTYRGVDTVDSEAVKANEDQMNKALVEIK